MDTDHILSSYPRSGNHLLRFIIEYVTGFPTKGCSSKDKPVCTNIYEDPKILEHVILNAQYIIRKTHIPCSCTSLIAITRDYRECIVKYLKYNITRANEADILCEIKKYVQLQKWHLANKNPVFRVQYENIISSDEAKRQDLYNLILFIIAHNSLIDACLHTIIIERLDTLIANKPDLFRQCAGAKNRHWGGYNSSSQMKYHILRLPFSSRHYFETLWMQSVKELPEESSEGVIAYMDELGYSPGYVDYVILPTGGICNRIRTILMHIHHFRRQNLLSKDGVKTRLYVLWKKSEHCRQTYADLFQANCLRMFHCTIVSYDERVHESVCIDPLLENVGGKMTAYSDLYRAIAPASSLQNAIQNIVTENTPFIAIHVRRTDHIELAKSKGRFTEDEKFYAFIEKYPKQYRIFVATDNCNTQTQFRKRYGKRVFWFEDIPPSTARRHHLDETGAVVDLFVCSYATHFMGSGYSSFTDTIEVLRNNRIAQDSVETISLSLETQ